MSHSSTQQCLQVKPAVSCRTYYRRQAGMALVTVLIVIVGMAGLAAAVLIRLNLESKSAEEYIRLNTATVAAESGLEYATNTLWSGYLSSLGNNTPLLNGFRVFLDKKVPLGTTTNILTTAIPFVNGASIDKILVDRTDSGSKTLLKVKSTASYKGRTRTVVQIFDCSGESFTGFDYALLAKNIDCVMCHAEFDNVDRVYNTDPSLWGTFDRVKVASLESLLIRTNDTQSRIAGTLYTRGNLLGTKGSGNNGITNGISAVTSLTGSTFIGYAMDSSGKIQQDKKGQLITDKLDIALLGKDGLLPKYGQVYANYPESVDQMTDGILPTEFPAVITDANGNRKVDDEEWKEKVASSTLGSVSGGVAYGVPTGKTLDTKGLPTKSNAASSDAKSGYYDGNMVLVGTDAEPIVIDGTLAVNGDVVVSGPVKGAGKIIARNNIYFVGDSTYADDTKFGTAKDGSQNLMSYGAGGNIVIGDFLTPENYNKDKYGKNKVVQYDDSNAKYPSYLSTETMDLAPALDQGYSTSFSAAQMMQFNKSEYERAAADKSYVPRYYAMGPGMKVYRQSTDDTATDYENWCAAEITAKEYASASISTLLPSSGWISPSQFKLMWWNDERSRKKDVEERLRIDGLLYTDNTIIGGAHSYNRHNSLLNGTLEVRGAIVAADLGLLSPGDSRARKNAQGFRLYYDKRVKNYLNVGNGKGLSLVKGIKLIESPGITL